MPHRTPFCFLFLGLVLAYKRKRPVADCIQIVGLPPKYARITTPQ